MAKAAWTVLVFAMTVPQHGTSADLNDLLGIGRAIIELDQRARERQPPPPPPQNETRPSPPPTTTTTGAPSRSAPTSLVTREDIRTLQIRLAELGYDPGPADGLMGSRTRNAIIAFERDRGMPAYGQPSQGVLSEVTSVWAAQVGTHRRLYGETLTEAPATARTDRAQGGPSFDCSKARTATERAICDDPGLSRLDRGIAASYASALETAGTAERERILQAQRRWIAERDRCGEDRTCLATAMSARNFELSRELAGAPATERVVEPPRTSGIGPADRQEVAQSPAGLTTINGRVVLFAGSPPRDFDVVRQSDALGMQLLALTIRRPVTLGDRSAGIIGLLPADEIRSLALQSLGSVPRTLENFLAKPDAATIEGRSRAVMVSIQSGDMGSEFQVRAFFAVAARRLEATLDAARPQLPLRARLYCRTELPAYDFDRHEFPLDHGRLRRHCNIPRLRLPNNRMLDLAFTPPLLLPPAVPMAPSEAERFRENFMVSDRFGRTKSVGMYVALDFDVTAETRANGDGTIATAFTAKHVGGVDLVSVEDWSRVLYRFDEAVLPKPVPDDATRLAALASASGRVWNLADPLEREALDQRVGSIGFENLSVEAMTSLQGESVLLQRNLVAAGEPRFDLARALGQREERNLSEIAAKISLPRDHVVWLDAHGVLLSDRGARVAAVFPHPVAEYGFDIPAALQEQERIPFRLIMAAQAGDFVELPDRSHVLLIRASPATIELLPQGNGAAQFRAEAVASLTFEPSAEGAPIYRAIDLIDAAVLGAHVARSKGVDLADFYFELLTAGGYQRDDAFTRRDEASRLAAEAPARLEGYRALGAMRLGSYDFATSAYRIESLRVDLRRDSQYSSRGVLANRLGLDIANKDGLDLPIPADQARDWQAANPSHPEYLVRAELELGEISERGRGDNVAYRISARVSSLELLVPDAEVAILDPRDTILNVSFAPAVEQPEAEEPEPEPAAPPDPLAESAFDILGLRLGQALPEAIETAIETIGAETSLRMTRQAWIDHHRDGQDVVTAWSPFREAVLLSSADESDIVTLFHEPDTQIDGRVSAVLRSRRFPDGAGPGVAQLRGLLIEKYGEPSATQMADDDIEVLVWTSEPPPGEQQARSLRCESEVAQMTAWNQVNIRDDLRARDRPNRPHWLDQPWLNAAGEKVLPPRENPLDLTRIYQSPTDCERAFVTAMIEPAHDGRARALRMVLVHPNEVFRQTDALREALENAPVTGGNDAPAIRL